MGAPIAVELIGELGDRLRPLIDPAKATPEQLVAIQNILKGGQGLVASSFAPGSQAAVQVRGGPLLNGVWVKLPAIYRLLLSGTGTVTIDQRSRDGTVTANVATYTLTGFTEDYPYFNNAYEVRATLTGTATAEIV